MELSYILSHCDHTLLRPDASMEEIMDLCDDAITFGCASVCIPPCHVSGARRYVGDRIAICTVIGFPNGYSTTATKVAEAIDAIENGADELDVVVNLGMVKDRQYDRILDELRKLRAAALGKVLKVIIETCQLTEEEKRELCKVVSRSGADYIKTSTGFSTGGATQEDVAFLRSNCPSHVKVKAAGGISSIEEAAIFLSLGAERLGTSRLVYFAKAKADEVLLPKFEK